MSSDVALREAMVGYQRGEMEAFERLYALLSPLVNAYLLSLTHDPQLAQDLSQETFMQIHWSRRTYRPDSPVRPWALAIARHVHLMHRRAAGRRAQREAAAAPSDEAVIPAQGQPLIERERIAKALDQLSPDRREAVVLHHVGGLSFKEIAARLGIRAGAAKVRASRGIAALRDLLGSRRSSR